MRCPKCGGKWNTETNSCSKCGLTQFDISQPITKIGDKLKSTVNLGRMELKIIDIIFVVCVNLSLLSIFINIITYFVGEIHFVWAHYVTAGVSALFIIIKALMIPKHRLPLSICGCTYCVYFALIKAGFLAGELNWFFAYLFPIGIILLDVMVFFFLLLNRYSRFSSLFVLLININASLLVMILMLTKVFTVNKIGAVMIYAGLAISALLLLNYIAFNVLSFIVKTSKRL